MINACLRGSPSTPRAFAAALEGLGVAAPLYISQNDGTVMNVDFGEEVPDRHVRVGSLQLDQGRCAAQRR